MGLAVADMMLPPFWKIKREFLASQDQIKAWGLQLATPLRRLNFDRREFKTLTVHDGERDLSNKLVLYLVFQPNGLIASNFIAIDYLVSRGHGVFLVSNGSLSPEDLEKLKPVCWKIIERENRGYDFGGYRAGLRYLKKNGIFPDMLTIVNDSIWFPLSNDSRILEKTEQVISDVGGAVCLENSDSRRGKTLLSYWITLRKTILQMPEFWDYWERYIPTGNKTLTVKLGERGFSRQMYSAGREMDSIFTIDAFLKAMRVATAHELRLTLKYGSFTDQIFEKECDRLLAAAEDTPDWCNSCLDFIERVSRSRNFLHSFCYPSIKILGVPFLKKNHLHLQILMRQKYLRAVYAGDLPAPQPAILHEIENNLKSPNQLSAFR